MSVKKSETAHPMQDGIRELSLHEYDLVAGGDGDGDGDGDGNGGDGENGSGDGADGIEPNEPPGGGGGIHNPGDPSGAAAGR